VQLLEITSPTKNTVVAPGETIKITWKTEGVASGTDVKIALFYNDQNLADTTSRMTSESGEVNLRVPSADFIRMYSSVPASGSNVFRVRIDVQHALRELSNGWSNRLYEYSEYFTVNL
jgi:hypothetical protein